MSVSAGRVLPIPKGAYVAGTTYQMLDVVSYNGNGYVAKRQNTNVTPTDGADWMLLVQGGGVNSFNGRNGAVTPTSGDYDADQIDYDPTDSGLTATDVQEAIDELANRPSGGVTSFNGRSGAVVPTASDYNADQIDYDNSGSDLSSTNVNDAIDEVSTKISGYWTSTVNALVGDTTVTFNDNAIKTTSVVEAYSQNASGSVTPIDGITVTNGQAVIRMPALTEATSFKLWIDENKVPTNSSLSVTTICAATITSTETTGTIFNSAKFSDYTMLDFSIATESETICRASNIVPVYAFNSPGRVVHVLFSYDGTQYIAVVTNVSDTQFKYKLNNSLSGAVLKVYGIR